MSRIKRRTKIYFVIFVVLLGVAVFLPAIMKTISDYFHKDQIYYYPHDLQREDYINEQKDK